MPARGDSGTEPSPKMSTLLPHLFQKFRPTFDGDSPIIKAGSLLIMNDVYILPTVAAPSPGPGEIRGRMLRGAFGSYALLKRMAEADPEDYRHLLQTPGKDCLVLIGICRFEDSLDDLLETFETTGIGNAQVVHSERFTLVTLADIVELLREGPLESEMSAGAVSSGMLSISPDAPLKEAINKMVARGVRRLFVDGRGWSFVSDRTITSFLFSAERLALANSKPEKWLDAKVSDTRLREAPTMAAEGSLGEAAMLIGDRPDDCLTTDDGKVVSRWDMVMKPWRAGSLKRRA